MPSKYATRTLSDRALEPPIEATLDRYNREDRPAFREVRALLNAIVKEFNDGALVLGASGLMLRWGAGAPTANDPSGSICLRTDGGAGTTLYVREGAVWNAK